MLLKPRKFKFKKIQKTRKFIFFKKSTTLKFGEEGLILLRPIQLTSDKLSRFKLFLKRATRKVDKTKRFIWFNAFPHLPITKKSVGLRMGKGKGKSNGWFTNVKGGILFVEFKNLRLGRSNFFSRQLTYKLGIKTQIINFFTSKLSMPINAKKYFTFKTFW